MIDNNSQDATGEIAADLISKLGCHEQVISEHRQGKGNALRRAFQTIDADVYLLADAVRQWLELDKQGKSPRSDNMPWLTWKQSAERLKQIIVEGDWYKIISAKREQY